MRANIVWNRNESINQSIVTKLFSIQFDRCLVSKELRQSLTVVCELSVYFGFKEPFVPHNLMETLLFDSFFSIYDYRFFKKILDVICYWNFELKSSFSENQKRCHISLYLQFPKLQIYSLTGILKAL